MSLRIEKINQEIRKRLMEIIQEEIDDPALGLISIVRVDTARDLSICKVYYSVYADKKQLEHTQEALQRMMGFIRHTLGKKVRLKFLPKLEFFLDDSIEYSVYIYQKIEEVKGDTKAD